MQRLSLCLLLAALLVACGLMSPQQQSDALMAIDEMLRTGAITRAQYEALREGILSSSTSSVWHQIAQTVAGAGLAYLGIQLRRGPVATPEERVVRKKSRAPAA